MKPKVHRVIVEAQTPAPLIIGATLAMTQRTTLKTLARHLDLSVTTVSRALKDGPEVKPETRSAVQQAARELGYRPNTSGLGLRTGKTHVIALVVPVVRPGEFLGDVGALPLIEGLTAGLSGTPYHLSVIPQPPDEDPMVPVQYLVDHGLSDGLIITSTEVDDQRIRYLHERGVPFVTFGRTEMATPHPYYDVDNTDFAYRAARMLYEKGRRRLVMITPEARFQYGWHRIAGFRRAALEFGITLEEDWQILYESKDCNYRQISASACRRQSAPDGYICGTEISAMGILSGLHEKGFRIRQDVDVVTMETSPLMEYQAPPIDGFYQDQHHAGRQLSSLLLRAIAGEPATALQVLTRAEYRPRAGSTASRLTSVDPSTP